MAEQSNGIKIHVLHTGKVCVAPSLPFGGEHCNVVKASGLFTPKSERLWLPVSCYLAEGPFGKSYDVFGNGSVTCVAIPGHADGLFAVKVTGADGRFVLLASDGGYATKSWKDMILPGIANNRADQKKSLAWLREQSLDPNCVELLANHDPNVMPHAIELA